MSTDLERMDSTIPAEPAEWVTAAGEDDKWFVRHLGKVPEARIGVGLSGGGIRSATLNLGILSVLRQKGILKNVHYLSTVSGGGYIGSWLVGNTLRREGFLEKDADWGAAIRHLRRYSNYLSPQLGFLSADSWTMAAIWLRNTILVQLSLLSVLLLPLLAVRFLPLPLSGSHRSAPEAMLWGFLFAFLTASGFMMRGLWRAEAKGTRLSQGRVQCAIVIPLFIAASALLSIMWRHAPDAGGEFTGGLRFVADHARNLAVPLGAVGAAFLGIAFSALRKNNRLPLRAATAVLSAAVAASAFFLMLVRLLTWLPNAGCPTYGPDWDPFVATAFMVPAILFVFSLAAVLHIGISGRMMDDSAREWWSRLGAWLGIYAAGVMAVQTLAFFSGRLFTWLEAWQGWSALGAWLASTGGAVLAAKSSRTGAKGNGGSKAMEALAAVGPYVFIAGLLILVSAALQFLMAVLAGTDASWEYPGLIPPKLVGVALAVGLGLMVLLSWRVDPNEFSLNQFYRNRLVRCFLGATRDERHEHPFTGFDFNDDVKFTDLHVASYKGPMPVVNTNLNLGASSDLTLHSRHSANFVFTPCYAGCGQAGHDGFHGSASFYRPERGLTLGTAVAISGAAASPNMGSHSSAAVSFLLTLFNVRLGWWVPNTRLKPSGKRRLIGSFALLHELLGQPGDTGWFVNLSDGGHFENLALYELVRRRCRLIIIGDGEQDGELTFGSLGNVIRMCESDFGARISLDVSAIRNKDENGFSGAHCAVGTIKYEDKSYGTIIYLKSSLTGDEPAELHQYKADNAAFPHESTGDQFFSEAQFESYRRLGVHIAETALAHAGDLGTGSGGNLEEFCVLLRKYWFPAQTNGTAFSRHAETLSSLWAELRKDSDLRFLDEHFFPGWQNVAPAGGGQAADALDLPADPLVFRKAFYFCSELIQLMENVYLDFDLETNESSPDLRGWMNLFRHWTWSYMFRVAWALTSPTYGARFQVFCERVFRLRPAPVGSASASHLPDAIALRLLEGREAQDLLNPVEKEIEASVRANGAAGAKLYVLALEATHPVDKAKARRIPTGFALCENNDLLYLRTQDHLRQTGLGGAFLDALVKGTAARNVRPVGPKDPTLCEWKAEEMELWVRRRHPGFVKGRR